MRFLFLLAIVVSSFSTSLQAQPKGYNYDEAKVPKFDLPDPLINAAGKKVTRADQWPARRKEIFRLFESQVYGRSPGRPADLSFRVVKTDRSALDGVATRKEVEVYFTKKKKAGHYMTMLLYVPNEATGPVPTFIGLNFNGNHSVHADPTISLARGWMRRGKGVVNNRATEEGRGASSSRWPLKKIVARGFAVATIYYGDIDPDYHDEFKNGVHPLFYKKGQSRPRPNEWGSISAWAWGLSRAVDYFETDNTTDHKRVIVLGHSRLGKTSLWAGASDERFAIVISNNSGCGGAALSRRRFGETVKRINTSFPHWFCDNFKKYNDNENALPVDQHMLVALMAPRPVYIASAEQDRWADPNGEFLSARYASPVYRLLGEAGLGKVTKQPAVNKPVQKTLGYHVRTGKHDVTDYDWQQYMNFADQHLGQK